MPSTITLSRLALGVAATASTASGAIVVFDINPDYVGSGGATLGAPRGFGALNFVNGSIGSGSTSFTLQSNYTYVSFFNNTVKAGSVVNSGVTPLLLQAGASIGPSLVADFANVNVSFYKADTPAGTHYIALGRDLNDDGIIENYGWLEIVAADGSDFGDLENNLTFTRFAFNDVAGQSILAGQTTAIPEASTLGLVGGLFGLVAAAHLRRRKLKQAAASDKFLALAAGEKLN